MNNRNTKKTGRLSRRDFLRISGTCAAVSATPLLSTLLNMELIKSAAAATPDLDGYKALVCVFLHGGIDSWNVLIPYETSEYADYASIRTNMVIPYADLASTNFTDGLSGRSFAAHPAMSEVHRLFQDGLLGFMANVGTLVAPTDKADYDNRSNLPIGLFSHFDQQNSWQSSVPQSRTQITGFAGRMADAITDSVNSNPAVSMNISTDSMNVFQTGHAVVPYVVNRNSGAVVLKGYNGASRRDRIFTMATDGLLDQTYSGLLKRTHAQTYRQAIDAAAQFNEEIGKINLVTDFTFPGTGNKTSLSGQLEMVAKTIGASGGLGQTRQVFFVSRGGWDHHANLHNNLDNMLPELSHALDAFYKATVELGVAADVTTFTASDFARTLSSNGDGADHGWGGNMIMMGGSVVGGGIYGQYPMTLAEGNELDVGRGRLIPTASVDEYYAELAMWFGIQNDATMETILPNIRNFYASGTSVPPLGFMNMGDKELRRSFTFSRFTRSP